MSKFNGTKIAHNGGDFQNDAKKYVINMVSGTRKLHIKNSKNCPHSRYVYEYYDFDSFEEATASGIAFTKCGNCFKTVDRVTKREPYSS